MPDITHAPEPESLKWPPFDEVLMAAGAIHSAYSDFAGALAQGNYDATAQASSILAKAAFTMHLLLVPKSE